MDKKFNIIVHLEPIIDGNNTSFAWDLFHDKGAYGENCGHGTAETEEAAFDAALKCYQDYREE